MTLKKRKKTKSPTFKFHAHIKTFLKSAIWTSFSLGFINYTVSVCHTSVDFLILNSPLEESFAGLASQQSIVVSRHLRNDYQLYLLSTIHKKLIRKYLEKIIGTH